MDRAPFERVEFNLWAPIYIFRIYSDLGPTQPEELYASQSNVSLAFAFELAFAHALATYSAF